MKMVFDKMIWF